MSELKAYKGDVTIPVYGTIADAKVYLKKEADAAIEEFKSKLENVQASAYAESVDAGMRERRLKRALWIAMANRADGEFIYWCARLAMESGFTKADIRDSYPVNTKRKLRTIGEWIEIWKNVKSKCLAKAKEYK